MRAQTIVFIVLQFTSPASSTPTSAGPASSTSTSADLTSSISTLAGPTSSISTLAGPTSSTSTLAGPTSSISTSPTADPTNSIPASSAAGPSSTSVSATAGPSYIAASATAGPSSISASATAEPTSSTSMMSPDSRRSFVIGIVILVVVLVGGTILVMILLMIVILCKKKQRSKRVFKPNKEPQRKEIIALDNVNYTNNLPAAEPLPYEYVASGKFTESVQFYESIELRSGSVSISNNQNDVDQFAIMLEENKTQDIYAQVDQYQAPAEQEEQLFAQIKTQPMVVSAVDRNDIEVVGHLGSGQFGSVDEGKWKKSESVEVRVALKTLKKGSPESEKVKFLQEAVTMAQFRHPNVVLLYGIVTKGEPIVLIVELVAKRDLKENLLEMRPNPGRLVGLKISTLLLEFATHIALGMQYLSSKGFIHRDLAARNVLVSDNNICKIADFGLSIELTKNEDYYMVSSGDLVPLKWTAPEAIRYRRYSTASDVWSYGCVLYEMWSLGHRPFEWKQNKEVIRIVNSGKRLAPPPGCPEKIYSLMIKCWHPDSSLRPSFREAILSLVGEEGDILEIPQDVNSQFKNLGAPLEVGEEVYMDLQTSYLDD